MGTIQTVYDVTENLNMSVFSLDTEDDFGVSTIVSSECYTGSPVGRGAVYATESRFCCLLAVARVLEWDYRLTLSTGIL